jgi:sigma-B regulation protein RsbQ
MPRPELSSNRATYDSPVPADVLARNNVTVLGQSGARPVVFAHGFGCDQNMWRFVAPAFEDDHQVVLFDYVGAGGSDSAAYDPERYATLGGYAQDVLDIVAALDLKDVVFVGHSVSSMVGVLAANASPERFGALVLVGPSPRYIDDGGYVGGFTEADIEGLLESLDSNYLGWSQAMAPAIMANPERAELGEELTASFCRADPAIQKRFARATFLSDNRADLARVRVPTLVLQCADDVIAPEAVGTFVHDHIPGSQFVKLRATGHCPNLSAPAETIKAIAEFLGRS